MFAKIFMMYLIILIFTLMILPVKHSSANHRSLIYTGNLLTEPSDSTDDNGLQKENTRMILSKLFDNYLLIKNSLSINDSAAAQQYALQFLENLQSLSDKIGESTLSRNWEIFMKYAPEAKSRIESSNTLSEQRFFFGIISNFTIDLVKVYGIENYTVYVLQCSDKSILGAGKWLSDLNDGKNPFLGPGNENCIEVIESNVY